MDIFGICIQTLIPVRETNSERAEMITQIIFGDTYTINETIDNWVHITLTYDNYSGWIDKKLVTSIDYTQYSKISDEEGVLCSDTISVLHNLTTNSKINVVAGSTLPLSNEIGVVEIGDTKFEYLQKFNKYDCTADNIVYLAKQFENAPYLWGGRTVLGIDCSGFSQIVFKLVGLALMRDASQQVKQGGKINTLTDAKPGDLAFFDNKKGSVIHVGILINNTQIIHASGWVRIDKIDNKGIFNLDTQEYTHHLCDIRRFI